MILFARRLAPAEVRRHTDRETQKSGVYFTNRTLTGQGTPVARVGLLREANAQLFSPISLWLADSTGSGCGTGTLAADNPAGFGPTVCGAFFARCLPGLFHQSHSDWRGYFLGSISAAHRPGDLLCYFVINAFFYQLHSDWQLAPTVGCHRQFLSPIAL